jgi:hypothetical protein
MTLLEPAARGVSSSPEAVAALVPVFGAYRRGDRAVDLFLGVVCGAGYRDELERVLPGGFATAVSRADLFFQAEMPAVGGWGFSAADAAQVTAPILNVRGADTASRFVEASDLVQPWFPQAEELWLPDTGHFLMVQRPEEVALGLVDFLERHPLNDWARSNRRRGAPLHQRKNQLGRPPGTPQATPPAASTPDPTTGHLSPLRLHIKPALGVIRLADLDGRTVRRWHGRLAADGKGQVIRAKAYRLLRSILNTAVEDGLIPSNPCKIRGAGVERSPE